MIFVINKVTWNNMKYKYLSISIIKRPCILKLFDYNRLSIIFYLMQGGVAQPGERLLRMQEGGGSIPLTSKVEQLSLMNTTYSFNITLFPLRSFEFFTIIIGCSIILRCKDCKRAIYGF